MTLLLPLIQPQPRDEDTDHLCNCLKPTDADREKANKDSEPWTRKRKEKDRHSARQIEHHQR